MSRDLAAEEKQHFIELYGIGSACEKCADPNVIIKIWEKYGTNAHEIGGDISSEGIVGAVVACDQCSHSQTLARSQILETA